MEMTEIAKALTLTYHPNPVSPADGRTVCQLAWVEGDTVRETLIRAGIDPHQEIVVSLGERLLKVEEWDTLRPGLGDILNVQVAVSGGGGGGGSNPMKIVASIAISLVAPGIGESLALSWMGGAASVMGMGVTGWGQVFTGLVSIGGNLLVGAMFSPSSAPSATAARTGSGIQESPTYSLSGGSNRARQYEPMPVVLGSHKIFPDYASKPYTEYRGDNQFLYQVFNFGIGGSDISISDIKIGDTPLSSYSGITCQTQNADGSISGFYGNVDTTAGADVTKAAGWISRTSPDGTVKLAVDLECVLYVFDEQTGDVGSNSVDLNIQYRKVGDATWLAFSPTNTVTYSKYWSRGYWETATDTWSYDPGTGERIPGATNQVWRQVSYDNNLSATAHVEGESGGVASVSTPSAPMLTLHKDTTWRYIASGSDPRPTGRFSYSGSTNTVTVSNASTKTKRLTVLREVEPGQYEVRVRRLTDDETSTNRSATVNWASLKSYQENSGWATLKDQKLLGMSIKASGQLNGVIQQLSAIATRVTPVWKSGAWVIEGTVNPAWWYLHFARGYRDESGRLLYGCGLPDSQIDIEAIKSWAQFCDAEGLTFGIVLDRQQSCAEVLQMISRVGFGSPSWATGKLGVVWDARNQSPVMAFGMSNICRGSFDVAYLSEDLPDEIVVPYIDPTDGWTQKEVRSIVPGTVGTPQRTTRIDVPGLISNGVALKFANHVAADQEYRRRSITWETDFEGFVCQRGDVVLLSHDLTQWGFSGRIASVNGNILELDRAVPAYAEQTYLMLKRPDGELITYEVVPTQEDFLDQHQDYVDPDYCTAYIDPNTGYVTLSVPPDMQDGYAPVDHMWFYSPISTPGKRVKISSVQPLSESRVRIVATDEDPAIYMAWDGAWVPALNPSLLRDDSPKIEDIVLSEELLSAGSGYIVNLRTSLVTSGGYHGAKVSYAVDGIPLSEYQIDGRDDAVQIPDAGVLTVTAAPIDSIGRVGAPVSVTWTIGGLDSAIPLPTPTGVTISEVLGAITCTADTPTHRLFAGIEIYASQTAGFTPGPENRVFKGPSSQGTFFYVDGGVKIAEGMTVHLRVAYYGLNSVAPSGYSDEISFAVPESSTTRLLKLSSTSQVFKLNTAGDATPSSATLTAIATGGLTGAVTFAVTSGTATLSGSGGTRTLLASDMSTDSVTISASITSGSVTYQDTVTIAKVRDAVLSVKGICFLRSATTPATPTGGSFASPTATGWSDGIPAGTNSLYMTTRIFTSDGKSPQQAGWTTPQLVSSLGQGVKVQFSVDGLSSWHDTPSVDDVYMRTGTSTDGGGSWSYSGATKIKGEKGDPGDPGAPGAKGDIGPSGTRGSVTVVDSVTTSPTVAIARLAVYGRIGATGSDDTYMVPGDTVLFTKAPSASGTFYFNSSRTWVTSTLVIDGNVIIAGSLAADRIGTGTLEATTKITVGSSTTGIVIDGEKASISAVEPSPYTEYVFTTSAAYPGYPISTNAGVVPSGWYDYPLSSWTTDPIYFCSRSVYFDDSVSAWSTPQKTVYSAYRAYVFAKTSSSSVKPASGRYTSGWSTIPPALSAGEALWIGSATFSGSTMLTVILYGQINGETRGTGSQTPVIFGNNGTYGLHCFNNGRLLFRADKDGLYIDPRSDAVWGFGGASGWVTIADSVVSQRYSGSSSTSTGQATTYIPLLKLGDFYNARVYVAVIGQWDRITNATGALTSSYYSRIFTTQFYTSGTMTSMGDVAIAGDSTDSTNFASTSRAMTFVDTTGATAGSPGVFLKLVSRTMYDDRNATYLDSTSHRYVVWMQQL